MVEDLFARRLVPALEEINKSFRGLPLTSSVLARAAQHLTDAVGMVCIVVPVMVGEGYRFLGYVLPRDPARDSNPPPPPPVTP